jgi:superfamily II DNA or RNA helicase
MMSPTHPKTRSYFQRGLFDGLTSFRELEGRISGLATKGERGDAFEVFAEAYLATVAVEKAKHVWPGASVPHSLRKRLALTIGDKGVDGIVETQLGEYHAYQAKFRTGRPSLTWDELSTFLGLADRVDQRVLITNCDRFADVVKQRTGFYAITGNDLDKLEPRDFVTIRAWLGGVRIGRQPKNPLPHQAEAIDNLFSALREHDRATALMACGTGKTLVALWVAERMRVQNILVLVPSLALLRQTLHEWARETSWQSFAHICVCSDPTVKPDSDELVVRPTDLDFPVTTDGAHVRAFLAAKFDGVKLVFSTYQSAHVVAAGMKRNDAFDLAIFDEAHKTAGREGVHFGFALNDKRLPIRKRLFLTATPRHYDIRRRDKEGDARLVYSMDAPEVYGPVAHKLTFAEAARRGIICDYKVIISVVTSDMVNDHLLRHGEVIVKGDAVKARHVASQLALQAAVAQHGVSKIFTFHRSVASAAAFTSDGPAGIGNHLSGFDAFHVNGAMPTSERENVMNEFRAASNAVISNAKCLTEGVDVPAVDMIAFLTPKRSRVDIVQATGRAMRKARGKTTGYVLVPLFVEQAKGETIEEALARTEFDEVWNVLQAMQEQDNLLATAIQQMREERGRTKGFDDTRFREKVEILGPHVSLEALRDSITTACIEIIGDNWDERFGELKAFQEHFGHLDVPAKWLKNPCLGMWVSNQRAQRKQGLLRADRVARLDETNFVWDAIDTMWNRMFAALQNYKVEHGNCEVPQDWRQNLGLGTWVARQRSLRRIGKLSPERKAKLEGVGFAWEFADADTLWDKMFETLLDYKRKYGNSNVPDKWPENRKLSGWVGNQRQFKKRGVLTPDRIKRLEEIDFDWNIRNAAWDKMFAALSNYGQEHGHCNISQSCPENPSLGRWVSMQRYLRKGDQLGEDRIRRLEEIDFVWEIVDTTWEEMFSALTEYKRNHNDCNVPQKWSGNRQLGTWVSAQRQVKRKGKLPKELVRRLDALGFVWDAANAHWEEMFAALEKHMHMHGNCNVSRDYPGNPRLGAWMIKQRAAINDGKLTAGRRAKLEGIGVIPKPVEVAWEEMFSSLLHYKSRHGDCNVPQCWPENQRLANWVCNQRQFKRKGHLNKDRLERLEQLGFVWDPISAFWDKMFAALIDYKRKHRHCNVPTKWKENRRLASWVVNQRSRRALLGEDRIRRLEEAGFQWQIHGITTDRGLK